MKRISTLLAAAAIMLTVNAQNAGDYVYTDNGKFKITTGQNLLPNGDFSNGLAEWTTDTGGELKVDTFNLMDQEGGGFYIRVNNKDNGYNTGSTLLHKLQVEAGKNYYVAYQVRAEEDVTTSTALSSTVKNYQNFWFNITGKYDDENNISFAKGQNYSYDWQTISYCYKPEVYGYIVIHFAAPYVGTCFDNFVIMETEEVVDDRKLDKLVTELEAYINNPLFTSAQDILIGFMEELKACAASEDIAAFNELASLKDEAIKEFLNQNTADLSGYVPNLTLNDLAATSANQTKAGAWTITDQLKVNNPDAKSRWSVKSADATNAPFDGMYLQDDIPYGSNNILHEATVWQTVENMPAGQYMFRAKVLAYKLTNKTGGRNKEVKGMKVFINSDSTECYPVDDEEATEFVVYSNMAETGNMKLGFYIPYNVANHIDIDFTDLRLIGWTDDQAEEYFLGKEMMEAKQELKEWIDSAKVVYNNPELLYGKVRLDSAITASQKVYDTKWEVADSLTEETSRLQNEIKKCIGDNATLTTLRNTILETEVMAAEEMYANYREKLIQAAKAAKDYIATLTADNHTEPGYTNDDIKAEINKLKAVMDEAKNSMLKADEEYKFKEWANEPEAWFVSTLDIDPILTSSNVELYTETSAFADHSLNGRFAFRNTDMSINMNTSHGLQITYSKKNSTTMAITGLKTGDQVVMDWIMGNNSHNIMIVSANAKVKKEDGTWLEYTKAGKDNANILPKDNTNGLSGTVRSEIIMTADGTIDIYQSSSNSTIRIYYVGITNAANVDGIHEIISNLSSSSSIYDIQGRRINANKLNRGIYISNGKKFVVK